MNESDFIEQNINNNKFKILSVTDIYNLYKKNVNFDGIEIITDDNLTLNLITSNNNVNINGVFNNNKIIKKVLYGININNNIDVTSKITNYLNNKLYILKSDNINEIIGRDPYIWQPKKLFIYTDNNSEPNIIIDEWCSNLQSDLLYFKPQKNNDILIYIIYHDDTSYEKIAKYKNYEYVRLIYIKTTKYFESVIFKYLNDNKYEWYKKKYVGIITYSFEYKLCMTMDMIYDKIIHLFDNYNCDLITLLNKDVLEYSFHGRLKEIFNYTLPLVGYSEYIDYTKIQMFCSNYWVTSSYWMEKYIDFALKYINLIDNDEYIQPILDSDAGYKHSNGANLCSERLMNLIGMPDYPHHAFVMERLPVIFFWKNNFVKIFDITELKFNIYINIAYVQRIGKKYNINDNHLGYQN